MPTDDAPWQVLFVVPTRVVEPVFVLSGVAPRDAVFLTAS
jgi:hypothetical protein